ncbi:cholesterol 7-alpha-monooxygenase [Triangularia setosa]|uniref:Cholesterol 7-alpha-monooxygenase n=1 Tax=Triangularia setosa TaxID=2587417 RepID=A0AAN6VY78_9PEZI|nr:cholesterol 7-alpha-monooxygenase [Podospora setosa]
MALLDECLALARVAGFYYITRKLIAIGLATANVSFTTLAVALSCINALLLNYVWERRSYGRSRRTHDESDQGPRLPPRYPCMIPFLGNVIPFLADSANSIRKAGSYAGNLVTTRVPFLGKDVYLIHDRETIRKVIKHQTLSSPMDLYIFSLKYMFGMPKRGLDAYRKDDSGPLSKPYHGSNVAPQDRIDYMLHENFIRQWSGPHHSTTTQRFKRALVARFDSVGLDNQWEPVDDLYDMMAKRVSAALTESIFGPSLLRLNPNFIDDLWKYDDVVPYLVRGFPRWLMPAPYRIRDQLRGQIEKWYAYARENFTADSIEADGDGDPYWGSEFVRHFQKMLSESGHDDAMLSAQDFGTIWAAGSNTVPSVSIACLHIFRDPVLLQRLRSEIDEAFPTAESLASASHQQLQKLPLLCSIFAETLRLHTKVFFGFSSPHEDAILGRYQLPKAQLGLWNSDLPHNDDTFWNTKGGQHPIKMFWADRFIVYPNDPESGPIRADLRKREVKVADEKNGSKPAFTTEGLDGAWVPYGAGIPICPGRLISKNVILHTTAFMVKNFDVELLTNRLEISNWRYGLGVGRPAHVVPARIKRRTEKDG